MMGGFHNGYKYQNKPPRDWLSLVQDPGISFLQLNVYEFFMSLYKMVTIT